MLVTGGTGFIGRHLTKSLSGRGYTVVVLDIAEIYKEVIGAKAIYKNDIRNTETLQTIIRDEQIDTCIHLAAKVSVSGSISNPDDTLDTNVKGTMSVLEACSNNEVLNFVFASSAAVYGEPQQLPLEEDHVLHPLSPYGKSKVEGEELVATYGACKKIRNTIVLRFFNVYGENQNPSYAGVISKFAERLSKGLPPIIYGNGNQTRDFISVHDVARAIELAAQSELSGIFNIATGKGISINDLASKMTAMFNLDLKPMYLNAKEGDITNSYGAVARAKNLLNFSAKRDLGSELRRMFVNPTIVEKK